MAASSSDQSILRTVRAVVALEADALRAVARSLGPSSARAVRLIAACRGKVVVTGIGKSGIVAQKIAATFASTGTPAIHLHPAEGLHGDIGVVERRDLLLAVGKSGESPELNALLPELKRLKVKIVAITAQPRSTLAKAADEVVLTPIGREACPLDLAPTSSTTAALAVGDALAVALMRLRGFKREHFARLHPGGQLGRRLTLRVADVMRRGAENPVVPVTATAAEALVEVTRKHAGAASVVDRRGRLVGLVTDYDIRRAVERGVDFRRLSVRGIMNARPITVRADSLAAEAVALMEDRPRPFNVLPVVDARGRAAGLVQIHDLRARGL